MFQNIYAFLLRSFLNHLSKSAGTPSKTFLIALAIDKAERKIKKEEVK